MGIVSSRRDVWNWGHLGYGNQKRWNLSGSMSMRLMRPLSNGGYAISIGHLLQPVKSSSGGIGLLSVELLAKGYHGDPKQPNKAGTRTKGCSLRTGNGAPLLRISIECGEVNLVSARRIYPHALVSLLWEGTLQDTKREM